jgi:hypothetical protein
MKKHEIPLERKIQKKEKEKSKEIDKIKGHRE